MYLRAAGEKQLTTRNSHPVQDNVLIQRISNADETALEMLYHNYYYRLHRFIGRTAWCDAQIDEIINDVMYTVWEKADTFNFQCQLSTWIFGIAYNKTRQALRDARSIQEDSIDDMDMDNTLFGTTDSALAQLESRDWLDSVLKVLSPAQRAVIELTYFEGLHYNEIALLMDCPENTVKTRMHHARKILATHLQQ
jgi:RNA polymerase sigma factor (sigma-70 family)